MFLKRQFGEIIRIPPPSSGISAGVDLLYTWWACFVGLWSHSAPHSPLKTKKSIKSE